jgi:hypothetical protein
MLGHAAANAYSKPFQRPTVHRKQEGEELFVLKWEKEPPKQGGKGSKAHRLPKIHCKLGDSDSYPEPFPHRKTMKLQHFPCYKNIWRKSAENAL